MSEPSDAVAQIRRWVDAGGTWQVISRSANGLTVGLYRCDAGEEMDRLTSSDPGLAAFVDTILDPDAPVTDSRVADA